MTNSEKIAICSELSNKGKIFGVIYSCGCSFEDFDPNRIPVGVVVDCSSSDKKIGIQVYFDESLGLEFWSSIGETYDYVWYYSPIRNDIFDLRKPSYYIKPVTEF